ncbi:hypothetical protein ABMY35_08155 [Pseudoalteromonas sp. BZB3]|uniref:hypothetical protein n=1 Tax=Pseudoalteromonas sp. BZB3 TaxID=3136670 RepID=UPI0032C42293
MRYLIILFYFVSFRTFSITIDDIEYDINSYQRLDKVNVLGTLNDSIDDNQARYLLGVIYGYGLYSNKIDLKKAIAILQPLLEEKYRDIHFLLGSFLSQSENKEEVKLGIHYLEIASSSGDTVAMNNLFVLYKKGKYNNKVKLINYLKLGKDQGKPQIAILYGKLALDKVLKAKNKIEANEVIKELETIDYSGYEGDYYYMLSAYYGFEKSPLYDEEKRDFYLMKAYKSGSTSARKLLIGMGKIKELKIN